eukprot:SAG31_NODE_5001_length_2808_cov_1.497601_2_plen_481_part_00
MFFLKKTKLWAAPARALGLPFHSPLMSALVALLLFASLTVRAPGATVVKTDDATATMSPSLGKPGNPLHISFSSAEDGFALARLSVHGKEMVPRTNISHHGKRWRDPIWEASVLTASTSPITIHSASNCSEKRWHWKPGEEGSTLVLSWVNISVVVPAFSLMTYASISLTVSLVRSGTSEWMPRWTCADPRVGLGRFSLNVGRLASRTPAADQLLIPEGFGALYTAPSLSVVRERMPNCWQCARPYQSDYPETLWISQYLAYFSGLYGLYVGIHDPSGAFKSISIGPPDSIYYPGAGSNSTVLQISFPPAGLTQPTPLWEPPVPITIASILGQDDADTMWFDAAMLYRAWALHSADWTRRGPLSNRTEFWAGSPWNSLDWWLHTGVTLGLPNATNRGTSSDNPDLVVPSVLSWCSQLNACKTLAVQYYGWDRYQFDTRYPYLFPAQPNFATGAANLSTAGVRVVPYLNGILFDTVSTTCS